jgi:hypothetical protein
MCSEGENGIEGDNGNSVVKVSYSAQRRRGVVSECICCFTMQE